MKIAKFNVAASLLAIAVMLFSADLSAQNLTFKVGGDDKEKKEVVKEKIVEKEVEKSGSSVSQELKKMFGYKDETSLTGPRVENIGKFFLDKYTGEVTVFAYYKNEPVRWRVYRDHVPDDITDPRAEVNYQLIRYDTGDNDLVLVNINTGAMWRIDFKGLGITYKNARFKYVPIIDTEW